MCCEKINFSTHPQMKSQSLTAQSYDEFVGENAFTVAEAVP